ncbi:MAG: efflux transporter outer membrane subunit [Deltaproteobacteria bacterium]|nr:efflux transporter outer membrane subunit [Deltaproteobacteria bacterium]
MRLTPMLARCAALAPLAALAGCMMIGPDYVRPPAPIAARWMEAASAPTAPAGAPVPPPDSPAWWTVFDDPILVQLVETAYRQNPSLQAAGARVVEAQARRGIAIGGLFPQSQEAFGSYTRVGLSNARANQQAADQFFGDWQAGFDAAWELDVWGRFRRGIESADADLLAQVASYDDVLLSLIAEVSANYIQLRTLEQRLDVARANVTIQERGYAIADQKYRAGEVTGLDSSQALSLLEDTRALIPDLEIGIRQTENTLSILLGLPPRDLTDLVGARRAEIPRPPASVALGVPADLLRRRPDVRVAERQLAAQSAQIGVAKADLLPRFALVGTVSVAAEDFPDMFEGRSFENFGGPSVRWAILNYGRITNNVRVQDARFQALIAAYEQTVLRAQAEVESALAAYLGAQRRLAALEKSVAAANTAVELAEIQYREGAYDYTRVLDTQQFLVDAQDRMVATRGNVGVALTALYKALGGGWEMRMGSDFVTEEQKGAMRGRTGWGGMLDAGRREHAVEGAAAGTEARGGGVAPRAWWPW